MLNPLVGDDTVVYYLTREQHRNRVMKERIIDACVDAFTDQWPDTPWRFRFEEVKTPARSNVSYRLIVFAR